MNYWNIPHKYFVINGDGTYDVLHVESDGNTRGFLRGTDAKTAKMIVDNDRSTQLYRQEYEKARPARVAPYKPPIRHLTLKQYIREHYGVDSVSSY